MATERFPRRIDRLLDQIEQAADQRDWQKVHQLTEDVLAVDLGWRLRPAPLLGSAWPNHDGTG